MKRSAKQLRDDAMRIWTAGVEAVKPQRLMAQHLSVQGPLLHVGDHQFDLDSIERIAVVGAGKAGTEMTIAFEQVLGPELLTSKQVQGIVNVPADCLGPTQAVEMLAARPAGVNEPTSTGVEGTRRILSLVEKLGPRDLCVCLISGGGSALMPLPIEDVTLEAKTWLTREMAARGGDIHQLNTLRREVSQVKGGGLVRRCGAGQLVGLILSDVMGDDLDVIASGPTVTRTSNTEAALAVLREFDLLHTPQGREVEVALAKRQDSPIQHEKQPRVLNLVIGNNATAVDAAGIVAEQLGYSHAMISGDLQENSAESVGRWLADNAAAMRASAGPDCLISGGESTVQLAPASQRGKGGRNQHVALAALHHLENWDNLAIVSGGTDGEDGPTDAAGARVDVEIVQRQRAAKIDVHEYLLRNDAYHFFEAVDGLIKTGPTHTNVCDLRVVCVSQ